MKRIYVLVAVMYRVPLILSVERGAYDGVIFMENGERVGVVCV